MEPLPPARPERIAAELIAVAADIRIVPLDGEVLIVIPAPVNIIKDHAGGAGHKSVGLGSPVDFLARSDILWRVKVRRPYAARHLVRPIMQGILCLVAKGH